VKADACTMCEEAVNYLKLFVNNNATEQEVQDMLENEVCSQLGELSSMVSLYHLLITFISIVFLIQFTVTYVYLIYVYMYIFANSKVYIFKVINIFSSVLVFFNKIISPGSV